MVPEDVQFLAPREKVVQALEQLASVLVEEGDLYVAVSENFYDHPQAPDPHFTEGVIYTATFVVDSGVNCRIELGRSALDTQSKRTHTVGIPGKLETIAYLGQILVELTDKGRKVSLDTNQAPSLTD